jgi:hypothetical protein
VATKYSALRIRFHSRQASKNPSLRTGEKTLPDLLIDALEAIFEGEDLIDELGNNAGGDVFIGKVTLWALAALRALPAMSSAPWTPRFLR